jgi:PAS domain S-box-containing protein
MASANCDPMNVDVLNLVQESIVLRDRDGRISGWNAASERLYGWGRTAALGRAVHELLHTDREGVPHIEAGLRKTGSWEGDVIRRTADGVLVTVHLKCMLRDTGQIIETGVDVTAKTARLALDASEERYRSLFHFLPVAMFQLDRRELVGVFKTLHTNGVRDLGAYFGDHPDFYDYAVNSIRVIEINARAVELFRAQDARQLLGSVARLWSESRETIQEAMAARFAGAPSFEAEMKIRTFDDHIRDVLYVAHFPEAYERDALGLACLVDISDRVKAQAKLTQMQADFSHAARISMLGELTASIAHEINQPLGAILTNGEATIRWLSRAEPDLSELRALSTRTIADARRAADIIGRIRSMASRNEQEPLSLAINSVVEEVLVILGPELKRQAVSATLDLRRGLPDIIGDRVQLQQVFMNLAVNAMQAMSSSTERRLIIRTDRLNGEALYADVEDTGPGIPENHLDRLFQSFFTTKKGGMGIGLAICRSIIEAHRGQIEAANLAGGKGARFRFVLPAVGH